MPSLSYRKSLGSLLSSGSSRAADSRAIRIIARATFVSGGMEATKRGADDVVVAEQVVAEQFARAIENKHPH